MENLSQTLKDMTPAAREKYFRDHAYKIEQGRFFKKMDDKELDVQKDEFAQAAIRLSDKEDEFQQVKEDFNGKIKEMAAMQTMRLSVIRSKGKWIQGQTYMIDDQVDSVMRIYDEDGELIETRPLRSEEKQTSLLSINKTNEKKKAAGGGKEE